MSPSPPKKKKKTFFYSGPSGFWAGTEHESKFLT